MILVTSRQQSIKEEKETTGSKRATFKFSLVFDPRLFEFIMILGACLWREALKGQDVSDGDLPTFSPSNLSTCWSLCCEMLSFEKS